MARTTTDDRRASDRAELAGRVAAAVRRDGRVEVRPGLHLQRASASGALCHGTLQPAFCVVAQGSKLVAVGEDRFRYDPAHYLVTTMTGLPAASRIADATPGRPYLSVRLTLDPAVVTSVLAETGAVPAGDDGAGDGTDRVGVRAVAASPIDDALLDATVRLVRLAGRADEYRAVAPLVVREIVYRLLVGPQAGRMRHLVAVGGRAHRMARAVDRLTAAFDKPLRITAVARDLGLSPSAFHAQFKAATAMTPLQFQKALRLREARRLMLSDGLDAAEAGHRVGYDDPSHFSRDYKRQFGRPPARDVGHLRTGPPA